MSISLLGGFLKGTSLEIAKGDIIRPTLAMLKRRLFDSQQVWDGRVFIDMCAGSGSMGFEALSRGAEFVVLVEKSPKVFKVLEKNLQKILDRYPDLSERVQLVHLDAQIYLKNLSHHVESFRQKGDVTLYFDPPYEMHELYKSMITAELGPLSQLIIESDTEKGPKKSLFDKFSPYFYKEYCQGASYLLIYNF